MHKQRRIYLLKLLAVEEVAEELLDLRNTGRSTDQHDLVNLALINAAVLEDLLDGLQGSAEGLAVKILETGTSERRVEVLSVEEGVNLDRGLGSVGQGALRTLASRPQATQSAGVAREIFLSFSLEFLLQMLEDVGVEVLATKVGVTGGCLDGEDTALDIKQRHIESTTTQIVDQNVTLLGGLSGAETVGNGGSGRLVDDTKDIQASDGTGVLGGLALVVVEVGRDSDDGLLDLLAELGLGDLFHLQTASVCHPGSGLSSVIDYLHEDHRRDLLGRKGLGLAEVLDLDGRVSALLDDLEGPRLDILLDIGVIKTTADETPGTVRPG